MAAARSRNVCSIAPGAPFLPTFARALLEGRVLPGFPAQNDAAALADATIYVPTRRAARALAGELARLSDAPAVILPRIVPLGAMEGVEDALLFDPSGDEATGAAWDESLPEAVSEIDRRLTLTQLILHWGRRLRAIQSVGADGDLRTVDDEPMLVTTAPAQAFHLAGDLGALIDEMIIENIQWEKLDTLAPEALDEYWRITLAFLSIAIKAWPAHLQEIARIDGVERQAALIERRIAQLEATPPEARSVEIVLGSTGTNAATARLIAAIAASPRGAVVLPGLDLTLDEASWRAIAGEDETDPAAGHPQAALRRLLPIIGVERDGVRDLDGVTPVLADRARFVSEAMRPPETTDRWRAFRESMPAAALAAALEGVSVIAAADEREEALALAVALREALEDPQTTAALVTPDRNLARRVRAELARWNIEIDDSGGEPLSGAPYGVLARLALACAQPACASAPLLALLRHPLVRLGVSASEISRRVDAAEIALLRGVRPDLADIPAAIAAARARQAERHAHRALRALKDSDWPAIEDLLTRLSDALAPLRDVRSTASLHDWIDAHARAVRALVAGADGEPPGDDDAEDFAVFMQELAEARPVSIGLAVEDYAVFFDVVAREKTLRGPRAAHPRIKSLGLLEARLIHADVLLLGGLDETIWPPAARTDAFLSRPMRAQLGLSPPERRIGQTAHDCTQAMGAPRVVLSRALKRGGAPTTPSRFLQRLETLAGDLWEPCKERGATLVGHARRLDTPEALKPIARPEPKPDVDLRPLALSVTRIETLRRDPYSIYAERILRLSPLDALDAQEGAREAGTRMHQMLAAFQNEFAKGPLPAGAAARLAEIARETYASDLLDPAFRAFRWPRIEAICKAYLDWDGARREGLAELVTEERGEWLIPLSDDSVFKLTAEADRIERRSDGAYVVIDFKTGAPPSGPMVISGLSPQLTLEAKMISLGAFKGLGAGAHVAQALYVKLGGREGLLPKDPLEREKVAVSDVMDDHYAGLVDLLEQFRKPQTPYLPRPYPQFVTVHGSYDHLSRHREWSAGSGEGA